MHGREEHKTIMLVEDEALIAVMEKEALQRHGFSVVLASSGEEAIEIARATPNIELILMDIDLGKGMDGTEAAEIILKEQDIPILFLSSHTQPEVVEKTEHITSFGYVVKNSGETVLVASVKMAFKLYEAQRGLEERGKALQESEDRYRTLFDGAGDAIFIHDDKARMVAVNATACERLGYTRTELMSMAISSVEIPENGANGPERMALLMEQGHSSFETVHMRKDKSLIPTEVSAQLITWNSHRVIMSICRDITRRRRIDEELRTHQVELEMQNDELHRTKAELEVSRERYFSLYDLAPVGYLTLSEEGLILEANIAAADLFGTTRSVLTRQPITRFIFKDDQDTFYRHRKQIIETGYLQTYELRMVRKDGTQFWAHLESSAVLDTDDARVYRVVLSDITGRKETEEEIIREREKLKTISDNAPLGMTLIDKDGHFTYINPRFTELFGYDLSDIPDGGTWFKMVHPSVEQRHATVTTWMEDLGNLKAGTRKARVFTVICKDGTRKIARFIPSALISGACLIFCEDITELRQLENQLRQAQKMEAIGTLAGGIAHDFNNILTALNGYATLIQMKMEEANPLRVYVDEILTASLKAAELTQSLLAFSRQQAVTLVPLDINHTIKGAEKLLMRLLTEDIAFHTSLAKTDMVVMADKSQIDQILFNLVANARDAMPQGGMLTLETTIATIDNTFIALHRLGTPGEYVQINITDTGTGMDEITRQRIFDPFFTTKDIGKGTGLGLATVYGIVKQHNGYVTVESTLNRGSTLHIYLPKVRLKIREVETIIAPITGGRETILVAEDNEGVRRFMREALTGHGYTVREATDGEDAVERFREHRDVDLIIIDAVMPKRNGRETYEKIHRMDPHIKALFTSGYTKDIVLDKGIVEKDFNFIAKPLSVVTFLRKVREVLDGGPA